MKFTTITAPQWQLAMARTAQEVKSQPAMQRDDQLKIRAIQRWENEGGRIPPKPQIALRPSVERS